MRLFLRDSERRPDPAPVTTDDRKAILTGIVAWLVALVVVLVFFAPFATPDRPWVLWTCVVGMLLGFAGLVYTIRRHR
jgi:hypothetical protein